MTRAMQLAISLLAVGVSPQGVDSRPVVVETRAGKPDGAAVIEVVKDVIVALSAVGGAVIAGIGLSTWRRQLRGNADYEVARKVLRGAYRVRDAIGWVRNPMILPGEMASAWKSAGHPPESFDPFKRGADLDEAVYQARWREVVAAMSDLEAEQLEAEVLWGAEAKAAIWPLRQRVGELRVALERWLRQKAESARSPHPMNKQEIEDWKELDHMVYGMSGDESDKFSQSVKSAVEGCEDLVRPHLARRPMKRRSR
jgi:hypothetical protein